MSATAIQLLDHLRESGMEDDRAIKIAEAFDRRVEEAMCEAKVHADRGRAESEEKAKVQFVSAADCHARDKTLATREDLADVRKEIAAHRVETREDNAETNRRLDNVRDSLRADIRAIHHLLIGGLATIVAGIGAVIVKLFFGG